jgi:hypothetical protein
MEIENVMNDGGHRHFSAMIFRSELNSRTEDFK